MKKLTLITAMSVIAMLSSAQVPGTLSYQGILVNSSGTAAADGSHTVSFNFYKVASGGVPILARGPFSVTTYKGMFTFVIGTGTPTGNDPLPTLASDASYIGGTQFYVEVVADNVILSPRAQLSTVPYALTAQNANTMDAAGLTGTADLPNTVLDADLQDLADGSLTGSKVGAGIDAGNITTGILANSVTTAASANTASSIVARDASGNFSAGTITATLNGNASSASTVTTNANLTGPITSIGNATTITAGAITDANINASGITTAGKVSGNAITSGTIGGSTSINTTGTIAASTSAASINALSGVSTATSGTGSGVSGTAASSTSYGIYGSNSAAGYGVFGISTSAHGTAGVASVSGYAGVYGSNSHSGGYGVYGLSSGGVGLYGSTSTGYAGIFTGGNVGIGTLTPSQALHVVGQVLATSFSGDGSSLSNLTAANVAGTLSTSNIPSLDASKITTGSLPDSRLATISTGGKVSGSAITSGTIGGSTIINTSGTISTTGYMGIGTTSPAAPLHVAALNLALAGSSLSYSLWNISSGGIGSGGPSNFSNNAIRSEGNIWCNGYAFVSTSDKRIKTVIGKTNNQKDLNDLMGIEITDYQFIDKISQGDRVHKKVIAQQVQAVYPNAINMTSGVIPIVYEMAKQVKVKGNKTIVKTSKPHQFVTGDEVKLVLESGGEKNFKVTVVDELEFEVDEVISGNIFVYGKKVDDLLTVDYDALTTLNISATQQLSREVESLKSKLNDREKKIAELESTLEALKTEKISIERLSNEIEIIKRTLSIEAKAKDNKE